MEVNSCILSGRSSDIGVNLNTNDATLATATGDPASCVNLSKKKNIHCWRAKQSTLDNFLQVKDRDKLPFDGNTQQTLPVPTFRSRGKSTKVVKEEEKFYTSMPANPLPQ